MIEITIKTKLPSCNEYILACRNNKYLASKLKKDTENKIIYEFREQKVKRLVNKYNKDQKPYFITFKWYEKTKRRDKDNISFSKKFILDALQKDNIIKNDNNNYITGFKDLFYYDKDIKDNFVIIVLDIE